MGEGSGDGSAEPKAFIGGVYRRDFYGYGSRGFSGHLSRDVLCALVRDVQCAFVQIEHERKFSPLNLEFSSPGPGLSLQAQRREYRQCGDYESFMHIYFWKSFGLPGRPDHHIYRADGSTFFLTVIHTANIRNFPAPEPADGAILDAKRPLYSFF